MHNSVYLVTEKFSHQNKNMYGKILRWFQLKLFPSKPSPRSSCFSFTSFDITLTFIINELQSPLLHTHAHTVLQVASSHLKASLFKNARAALMRRGAEAASSSTLDVETNSPLISLYPLRTISFSQTRWEAGWELPWVSDRLFQLFLLHVSFMQHAHTQTHAGAKSTA